MAVTHQEERNRFTLERGGQEALLQYIPRDGRILHFTRTWVPPSLRGRGIGARLVKAGLAHARREGWRVSTSCWFVDEYLDRNPEYQDLRTV